MCMSSWNFKGFCFNVATTTHTHTIMHTHTLSQNDLDDATAKRDCSVLHSASYRWQTFICISFIKLHYWYMKSCDTASGDCVLWRYLVHTSGCVTLTCLLEREAHQTTIYTFRPLSCLPAVHACISRIGVTTVTDWASAFACIHPNEMINTHLTRLVVMLVDV